MRILPEGMNLKVLLSWIIAAWLLLMQPAWAQTDSIAAPRAFVSFSPQHLLVNGYHFYVEKPRPISPRHSIVYSPRFYAGKTSGADELAGRQLDANKQSRILGYGAEINHRFYLSPTATYLTKRFYLAYGPNFHHFRIKFKEAGWAEEPGPDGLKYYEKRIRPYQQQINRLGLMAITGLQQPMYSERFLIDMYLGFAFYKSYIKTNFTEVRYDTNGLDYGFSGLVLLAGLKFGVAIK